MMSEVRHARCKVTGAGQVWCHITRITIQTTVVLHVRIGKVHPDRCDIYILTQFCKFTSHHSSTSAAPPAVTLIQVVSWSPSSLDVKHHTIVQGTHQRVLC